MNRVTLNFKLLFKLPFEIILKGNFFYFLLEKKPKLVDKKNMAAKKLPIVTNAKYLLTDSRSLSFANETCFFAIKTNKNNGHLYLKDLYLKGVKEFVIETNSATDAFLNNNSFLENCTFWVVDNAIDSLQELAASHRKKYEIPIIGITGSNGKTIVKEWLGQILALKFKIVKNPKSYNSQIGVPLSVWQLNENNQIGLFEAGISKVGEMQKLEKVICPTLGLFTNIGSAHDNYFENTNQKFQEKLKLFKNTKKVFYRRDSEIINNNFAEYFKAENPRCELISWSLTDKKANSFEFIRKTNQLVFLTETLAPKIYNIPFSDEASIENICHCILVATYFGIESERISLFLANLRPIEMRLELKDGINNTQLIDDSYNNDFIGLKLAIDFLNQQKRYNRKIIILSEILEPGESENKLYENIAKLIEVNKIDLLIGIGSKISNYAANFGEKAIFFNNTDSFLEKMDPTLIANATILIKGARTFYFEKIVNAFQAKNHETFLEINLDNLTHNFNYFKAKLPKTTKLMAMVKAFAYGAGNKEVANLLQYIGADYLGVAYTDEGVFLRENGINLPIMVMNPTEADFQKILDFKLEPEIYSIDKMYKLVKFIENKETIIKIHLKLDTGMHRLGFLANEIDQLIKELSENPNIIVASIFSHLVGAENPIHDTFSHTQFNIFEAMSSEIIQNIGYKPLLHILNSAGISRFKNYAMDMVRLGVGMYGVSSNETERQSLEMVGTLKTKISQIKHIAANETIGYGRNGQLFKDSKIATIAIGYADGYNRKFGNGTGQVLINGSLCPTIGSICMDMTMVDITEAIANEGDEVIIFGKNPSVYDLAKQIDTIPYEILTNIGERVKRVFYKV